MFPTPVTRQAARSVPAERSSSTAGSRVCWVASSAMVSTRNGASNWSIAPAGSPTADLLVWEKSPCLNIRPPSDITCPPPQLPMVMPETRPPTSEAMNNEMTTCTRAIERTSITSTEMTTALKINMTIPVMGGEHNRTAGDSHGQGGGAAVRWGGARRARGPQGMPAGSGVSRDGNRRGWMRRQRLPAKPTNHLPRRRAILRLSCRRASTPGR